MKHMVVFALESHLRLKYVTRIHVQSTVNGINGKKENVIKSVEEDCLLGEEYQRLTNNMVVWHAKAIRLLLKVATSMNAPLIANGPIGANGVFVQKHVEQESKLLPEGYLSTSFLVENYVMEKQLANEIAIPANVQVYHFFTNEYQFSNFSAITIFT